MKESILRNVCSFFSFRFLNSRGFISRGLNSRGFISRGLNSRGFNMFSAIVAIILIMTGVVLTNTLISTEEKTSRQIYSMLNNYQLSDTANLARADALQSFNYNFREKLENYLTFDDYKLANEPGFRLFNITSTSQQFTFDSMKKDFECTILLAGGACANPTANGDANAAEKFNAALSYVADRTVDQFLGGTYGRYSVYLSDKSSDAKAAVYNATKSAIVSQGENFLEVIGCSDDECPNGSFYFNIPLNNISDAQYEALPRIVVKDLVSQEEIKMAILPRTNIKVYIPLRFFKALYEAKKTANSIMQAHNLLAQYKLGFCEGPPTSPPICRPRTNPLIAQTNPIWDQKCPTSGFEAPVNFEGISAAELDNLGINSYKAGGQLVGSSALKVFGAAEVCKQGMIPQGPLGDNAFQTDDANFIVKEDLLMPGDERINPIPGCGLNKLLIVSNAETTYKLAGGLEEKLSCGRITAVRADIVFSETNPDYIVKGTAEAGKKDYYKIMIIDETYKQVDPNSYYNTSLPICKTEANSCEP